MGAARTAFARANARFGVLAGVAAVVLLLAGLGTAVVDVLTGSATSGLRAGLSAADGASGAMRWQIRVARDAEAQASEAAHVLDRMIVPHGAAWQRSIQTMPVAAEASGTTFGAVLTADPGIAARAELVDGEWPDDAPTDGDAVPTAVNAAAAEALGLEPGSVVALDGGIELVVVGVWRPDDARDPRWFGEPIVSTGAVADGAGPFLVAESTTADVPAAAFVRWTATVDPAEMTVEDASALRADIPDVEPALRDQPDLGDSGLGASGGLGATLTRLLAGIGAVRALAPLPVLLLAITGFATLWRLAALLGAARRSETLLLRARGASATRLTRDSAIEVLAIGLPAAAVGALAAESVLALVRPDETRDPLTALLIAATALVAAVVLVSGRAFVDATRPVRRGSGDEVGRVPRTAVAGGVLLVIVIAALSLWQFTLYGSPLVTSASGTVEVDPLAVLAPVLVLFALALVGLGLARPIGALLERIAAARPALVPALPMRQLARRSSLFASASLVAMLAIGGLTLTATFAGAWQSVDAKAAALSNGAELRVALPGRDIVTEPDPSAFDDVFAVSGVTADAPVFRGEVRLGSDPAMLVAAPVGRLEAVAPGTGLSSAASALADSAAAAGVALPEGAATLDVELAVRAPEGTPGEIAVTAWLLSEGGAASPLPAREVAIADGGGTVALDLPKAPGLRLLGLQAGLVDAPGARDVQVSFGGLGIDGGPASDELAGAFDPVDLSSKSPVARATLPRDDGRLPVVIGSALAAQVDAEVGDPLDFRTIVAGVEVEAVVAGIAPAVPTAGSTSLLADLGALERIAFDSGSDVPQFGERWLAASDPDAAAAQIERDQSLANVSTTRRDVSTAPLISPAVAALWAGAAGALLFAVIALVALTSALSTSRFGEIVVLRVLGVGPRVQARARFAELAATVAGAVVVGVVVGTVTAWFTARELARATIADAPSSLHAPFALDWWPWVAGTAGFVVAAAVVAGFAARAVRRTASRPGLREEER